MYRNWQAGLNVPEMPSRILEQTIGFLESVLFMPMNQYLKEVLSGSSLHVHERCYDCRIGHGRRATELEKLMSPSSMNSARGYFDHRYVSTRKGTEVFSQLSHGLNERDDPL